MQSQQILSLALDKEEAQVKMYMIFKAAGAFDNAPMTGWFMKHCIQGKLSRAVTCVHTDVTKQRQKLLTLSKIWHRAVREGLCGSICNARPARTGLRDFLTLRLAGRCSCLSRHLWSEHGLGHSLQISRTQSGTRLQAS